VSRRHARIIVVSGAATIEDLGSTNGTHVNGERISVPTRLAPGNEVALGSEVLQVRMHNPSALTVKIDPVNDSGDKLPKR
jgi:pSer/pThr/pTyr-binding forkhead associated (FHA) protein